MVTSSYTPGRKSCNGFINCYMKYQQSKDHWHYQIPVSSERHWSTSTYQPSQLVTELYLPVRSPESSMRMTSSEFSSTKIRFSTSLSTASVCVQQNLSKSALQNTRSELPRGPVLPFSPRST